MEEVMLSSEPPLDFLELALRSLLASSVGVTISALWALDLHAFGEQPCLTL